MNKKWVQQCEEFSMWVEENCPKDLFDEDAWTKFHVEAKKRMPANFGSVKVAEERAAEDADELDDDIQW